MNAAVEVGLNEAVSYASVGQSAITVTAGGQAVAGTVTVPNATTLLFTPSSSLAVSTSYSVSVGGFTDLAGNAATSFTSSFTTGSSSTPVKTGPTVVSVSPANGATAVEVNSTVTMTFSAPVNPLTVNASTFQVYSTANNYVLAGTYAVSGAVVTFTPASSLPGSTTIPVYQYGIQDTAGNTASSSNTTFTTTATADTTTPTVTMVTPSTGQTGVGSNGQVVVVFSKSMNPSTLNTSTIALLAGDSKQSFSINVSADNRTLTLSSLSLPGSTVVTLAISNGVADLSGNALPNFTSHFTTAPAFDTTHGSVVSQRPGNGATGVLTTASPVTLFVNKPLNASTITANTVHVTQNGQLVSGTLAVVGNGQAIEFTPSTSWTYGSLVQVFLDATTLDTNGNTVTAYKGSFTVLSDPATTTPTLVNYSPMSGATGVPINVVPDAQYSQALDPSTVTAANVYLYGGGKTVAAQLSLDATGTIIHLTPSTALAANTYYSLTLNHLKGANGTSVSYQGYSFTTGVVSAATAPTVVTVSPANKLSNVPLNANIGVIFSGVIDPLSVSGSSVSLTGGGTTAVPATISFSNSNQKVLITPQAPLPASTVMTLTISGVTDVASNAVTPYTSTFTTSTAAATSNFGVVVENPAASATNVPVNAAISLQANAEVDGTTVNPSSFQVYDTTLSKTVAGSYSLSTDGKTVYFVPTAQLAAGRTYQVNFYYGGMTDVAGNPLTNNCTGCLYNYTFTTGFAASTAAPQVTGVSPAASLTGVPINAQIVVTFNEPVNAESLGGITLSASGSTVALNESLSSGNQILTITPAAGLLPNTSYTLTISGVTDQSGNAMASAVTSTFTTGGGADLIALTIATMSPANGATGVPLNSQVKVNFSKQLNTILLGSSNLVLYPYTTGSSYSTAGTLSAASDGKSITLQPAANLLAETLYCASVSGVVDLVGNALSGSATSCFTTGSSTQSSGPVVLSVSPGNGAAGVPVNAVVEVGLSEAVSAASVSQSAVTVTAGGQAVAGTVTVPNATTLLFTPASSLAVSTSYSVSVGGFTDLAGNAATAFSSSFTTGSSSTPVKTGPTVVSVSPANGATAVEVNSTVTMTFSAPVNPLTVNASTFQVYSTANNYVLAGTYAVSGAVVTFTPASPLPGSATIRVYEYGVQDAAGNTASSSNTQFTTAATPDTTAPSVVMVTPSNGQTGVGPNGQVVVVFSESMNPSTLTTNNIALLAADVKQSFGITISADNRTVTLSGLNLPASTVVTLAISGAVTDLSGNALGSFTSQFTTAAAFDTTHASVVSQRPGTGATNVSTGASPVVLFVNKPLNASTITSNTVQVTQNGQVVSGTLAVTGNGQTITFTPASAWTYGALVQVFLEAALDTSGNTVTAYKGSFTVTGDPATTAPALVNISPMNGATAVPLNAVIDAQYSGALDSTTVIAANVYLNGGGKTVTATLALDSTGTIIHLTPSAPLTASTQYCYSLYNLKGSNGTTVSGQYGCFTTGTSSATTGPTVTVVSPANKLTNVPLNANLGVVFSAPVDPVTVTGATVSVSGGGMTSVPASISFSGNNTVVHITPEAPLPASTAMTLTVSGVTDVAGNAVTAFTSSFTTGTAAATSNFGVVVENPVASATGVPVNAAISLQANSEIDGTTVSTSSFQVYDTTLNQTVAGSYSLSADGRTVYFVPAAQLATGRTYQVNFYYGGMTDVAGNPLTNNCTGCLYNYTFTTGFTASTAAPQVTGVSPAAGLTGVPINAQIVVAFNEPVNGESLGGITLSANGSNVALNQSLGSGNQLLTLTPTAGLLPNTAYTLTVNGVADQSGNTMTAAANSNFNTGGTVDLTPLTITSVAPLSGATGVPVNAQIRVGFSKGVNVVSLAGGNLVLYPASVGSSYPIVGKLSVSSDGTTVTFTPTVNLLAETQYCAYVTGVIDLEGQSLSGSAYQGCFTTGGSSQSSGPAVVSISPANGATGVPVNALVEVGLNEALSAVSVGNSAITVSVGGQAIPGTVTMPNSTTLLWTPASNLATSASYSVGVSGFTDLAGNAATTFTSGFTTGSYSTPVRTGPTVLSVSPANGMTAVAVNTPVVMTFSAAVNPLTVNTSTFQVYSTANNDVVAGTYAVSGAVVTFTPAGPLPGSATMRVYEYGVQDAAGNTASSSNTTFTTAATADTTAPTVVMVTPSNGQTGVGLNGQVVVAFSKSMNPSTLTTSNVALLAGDLKQSFSVSVSVDNRTMTLYNLSLPGSTVITLVISNGATDLNGNALANYTSQFTTATAFDTTHATVANQRPGNGVTGVSTSASPVVLFLNKTLDPSTVNGNTVQVTQNGQLESGTLAVVGNGQTITFTPSTAWTNGALVQVFLDATALDTNGNTVTAYKGSFTVVGDPSTATPALVNISPMSGATAMPLNAVVDAQYSGALDPTTVIAANVYLNGGGKTVTSTLVLDSTKTIIHLKPSTPLAASTQYCYSLYNLKGSNGTTVSGQYGCFTTGTSAASVGPTVTVVSPANNLGNVPLNANIAVLFNTPIDPLTVSGTTIALSGGGASSVPASISFSNSNQKVLITPEAPLPASTVITLTISGVTDVAGNAVTTFSSSFTTGTAAATSNFGVVVENPVASATGVPVNAAISLQANSEIDGTTVSTSSFQVYDTTLNQTVAGSYSLSPDGETVYFVPAAQLATGRSYQVNFYYGGMTDVAGNPLTTNCTGCLYNYTFTTGFTTSTAAPQVTGISPADGLTKVPLNAQLVVSFNEPVNAESLGGVTLSTNGSAVAVSNVLSSGSQLLTITPVAGLLPNTTYTLVVAGVADLSGNAMTTPFSTTFTTSSTADLTQLTIVSVSPASNSTGVPLNAQIRVAFSKGVNTVSLAGGNLVLYPSSIGSSNPVAGTVSVSADGTIVTFAPATNLLAETQYCTYVNGVTGPGRAKPLRLYISGLLHNGRNFTIDWSSGNGDKPEQWRDGYSRERGCGGRTKRGS